MRLILAMKLTETMKAMAILIKKDLRLEANTGQLVGTMLLFALIAGTIFSMSFLPGQENIAAFFPGIYWFTIIFAALLILNRSFHRDKKNSCQEAILLAPVSQENYLLAKLIFNYMLLLLLTIIISPVLVILFSAYPRGSLGWLIIIILLVNLGLAANGTLLAALATATKFSEILLPILLLPVLIPLILAAVEGTRLFYITAFQFSELQFWLLFIILYDSICVMLTVILAPYLLK